MSTNRITARTIFFPKIPWITLEDSLKPEIKKILVFEAETQPEKTIAKWRKQISEIVKEREQLISTLKKTNATSFPEIQIATHRARQIFRYMEKFKENEMVLPYISLTINKKVLVNIGKKQKANQSIKLFPAGPIIVKTTIRLEPKNITRDNINKLTELHEKSTKRTPKIIQKLVLNENISSNSKKKKPTFIVKKTGTNYSSLSLQKQENPILTKDDVIKDNSTGINPSFKIITNRTKPNILVRNIEEIIDWYFAFLGASEWLPVLISNKTDKWSVNELVNYYSLVFYIFNPEAYYKLREPLIYTSSILRLSVYRKTWKQLFYANDLEKNLNRWRAISIPFLKRLYNNFLIFNMFLDQNSSQVAQLTTVKFISNDELQLDIKNSFPSLNCREAVIFTLFLELARSFFIKHVSPFFHMLETNFPKIIKKIDLMQKLIVEKSDHEIIYEQVIKKETTGWVSPNFFRQYLVEKKPFEIDETYFPKSTFDLIPNKDCEEPILYTWHPKKHFSKTPGKIINSLIEKRLVEVKQVEKNKILVRANLNNYLVKHLILHK